MGVEDVSLTLVDSTQELLDFRAWLGERRERISYDIETTGTNLGLDLVRLGQIGDRDKGWAFPCEGADSWYGAFKEALEDMSRSNVPIFAHNMIFDSGFMKRDGIDVAQSLAEDTMPMAQLNDSSLLIGLKPVARRMVDEHAVAAQALLDDAMKAQGWTWATVPIRFEPYWMYGALDPVLTCRIAELLEPAVRERYQRSYELELGATHVLRDAALEGMLVDIPYCHKMSAYLELQMQSLTPQLPRLQRTGDPVNPGSPQQVVEFLQSRGCVLTKKTDKGKLAADDEVVSYWEVNGVPECRFIREYRKADKLKNSYFDKMLELEVDGIVHPNIRVLGAQKTGRMSITQPALQTLPKSAVGRNAFLAREGQCLVMADFQGIEMRLLAHMANEQRMLERYAEGVDLHTWTASQIYATDTPTAAQRSVAKTSGFAKIYGAGVPKFALSSGLPEGQAATFLERYDQLFPGVKAFQERVSNEVHHSRPDDKQWGEVHTEFGRRLMVPKDEAYKGVNYRDQGTAGEVLKLKLIELAHAGLGPYIRLPIHDEVVFEVPDDDVHDVVATIESVMPERQLFRCPLEVDVQLARRWGDVYE